MRVPLRILLAALGLGLVLVGCANPSAATESVLTAPVLPEVPSVGHRQGVLRLEGRPGTLVRVRQQRHAFWFGAALANSIFDGTADPADVARYEEAFLANFNSAVTENALKWLDMQPTTEPPDYRTVDAMLAWTEAHDIPLRGHNLYWGIPRWVQSWVKSLDDTELRAALEARARDIAARYRGRFAHYDLNNEMIHGNYYAERLGEDITLRMARWVLDEDPAARLYLNDYDILTGRRLDDYVEHIRTLLAQGVPLAGIGVQGHLHGDTFDPAALQHALDTLAQFDLPIVVTEFNFPGQRSTFHRYVGRARALTPAEEVVAGEALAAYYRICFAHPAVTGILMWGFWEKANWIPASSLYAADWTPKPALQAYRDLVFGEWWTSLDLTLGPDGVAEVPAFFGDHRVETESGRHEITLAPSQPTLTVRLD
jgi:endo-1,4-beta-xylanase